VHLLREVLCQLQEVRENTINTEKTSYKYGLARLEQKLIIFNTLSTFYTYHNLTDYYHFILNLAGISLVNEHSMASYLVTGSSRGLGLAMVTVTGCRRATVTVYIACYAYSSRAGIL
jgi:hypothetical protein